MILRLESTFLQTLNKLGNPFDEENKQNLAKLIENNFGKIREANDLQQELREEYKPAIIELGKIGRSNFSLSIYYRGDEMEDDIPMSIRELLPTRSPIRMDILATISDPAGTTDDEGYMKIGEVYDDGDIHSHYIKEVRMEDQGVRPLDDH
jgi:hypothetical protein